MTQLGAASLNNSAAFLARPTEFEVKAAYLFQFLKFMQWPRTAFADSIQPIVIGIVGETPLIKTLEELTEDKTIFSRPVMIQVFQENEDEYPCHVLYIGSISRRYQVSILKKLKNANIFTLGDGEDFIGTGGMIGFVTQGNRLRFNINLKAIKNAGLIISVKILRLAAFVDY